MQDRFKFRVWSEVANCYMENPSDVLPVITTDGDFAYKDRATKEFIYFDEEFAVVEQCTGLKDKNGKLIYEGDIVKVIYNEELNTLSKQIYPMLFNDKVAKFGFKHPDGHFFYFTNDEDFSYVIIGNIHENPELLEQSDVAED